MGGYLSFGIATNVHISKNRSFCYKSFKLKEHKEEIINALGKVFDLKNYIVKEDDEYRIEMFDKKNCPIKFGVTDNGNSYTINDKLIRSDHVYDNYGHILLNELLSDDILDNITIRISFICLRIDGAKLIIENIYYILRQLLILNKDRYKNKLANSSMYYISG